MDGTYKSYNGKQPSRIFHNKISITKLNLNRRLSTALENLTKELQYDTPVTELEPRTSTNKAIKKLKNLTPIIEETAATIQELQSDTPAPRVSDTGNNSPRGIIKLQGWPMQPL